MRGKEVAGNLYRAHCTWGTLIGKLVRQKVQTSQFGANWGQAGESVLSWLG